MPRPKKDPNAPVQTKREKFTEQAQKRTVRAIKAIRSVGTLARPSSFDYNEDDVQKIIQTLANELKGVQARFEVPPREDEVTFSL